MEITNAIKSGDPKSYLSSIPVHQDGSCNGLQHYAALGRDAKGAESVNLSDLSKPQDVYSNVVEIVEAKRIEDEKNDVKIAKILNGFISRKVIKQTVMTTVYNVTRYGAKLQIAKQLQALTEFAQDNKNEASAYLADKTFQSLNQVFESARQIQEWLSQCAYLIACLRRKSVSWFNPLGLPIIQPYYLKTVKLLFIIKFTFAFCLSIFIGKIP